MSLAFISPAFGEFSIAEILRNLYAPKRPLQYSGSGLGQASRINGEFELGFVIKKFAFKSITKSLFFLKQFSVIRLLVFGLRQKLVGLSFVVFGNLLFVRKRTGKSDKFLTFALGF